jgi:hypothetical protein
MAETYRVTVIIHGADATTDGELSVAATPEFATSAPDLLRRWMNAVAGATGESVVLRLRDVEGIEARMSVAPVSADAARVIRSNELVSLMIDSADLADLRAGNGTLWIRPR